MRFELSRGFFGIVLLAAVTLQTECFDLMEAAIPGFNEADQSISNSADPLVTAAGDAPDAVARRDEWDRLVNDAYDNLDIGAIDRAIALDPDSNATRYDKAVILIARGDGADQVDDAIGRAYDVTVQTTDPDDPENGSALLLYSLSSALVRGNISPDSPEGQRVHAYLCNHVAAVAQTRIARGQEVGTLVETYDSLHRCTG